MGHFLTKIVIIQIFLHATEHGGLCNDSVYLLWFVPFNIKKKKTSSENKNKLIWQN